MGFFRDFLGSGQAGAAGGILAGIPGVGGVVGSGFEFLRKKEEAKKAAKASARSLSDSGEAFNPIPPVVLSAPPPAPNVSMTSGPARGAGLDPGMLALIAGGAVLAVVLSRRR